MRSVLYFQCVLIAGVVGCGSARIQAKQAPNLAAPTEAPNASAEPSAEVPECKLSCEPPRMVPRAAPDPDYTQREIDNANTVLASMTDDLLGCYKKRLRVRPGAQGMIKVDIVVGSDGRVSRVDATGGAILGDSTMACIMHRIEQGVFEPPHGGGNIHVQVPFTLTVVTPDDET